MALTRAVSDYKDSVKAATTTNIQLAGGAPPSVDGVSLNLNDSVLVIAQDDPTQNGIYRVANFGTNTFDGTWVRRDDFNDYRYVTSGALTFVEEGLVNGNVHYYIAGTAGNIQVGTTPIYFSNLYSHIGNTLSLSSTIETIYAEINTKTSYSDANVDAYMPIYSGNIQVGNLFTIDGIYWAGNNEPYSNSVAFSNTIDEIYNSIDLKTSYSNANVDAYMPTYTGDVQTGNLYTFNGIFWVGNNEPYANSEALSNTVNEIYNTIDLKTSYSNANVDAYMPVYTGNIQVGNLFTIDGIYWAGNNEPYISSTETYSNANVDAYMPVYTGNIQVGNLFTIDGIYWAGNNEPYINFNALYSNTNVDAYMPVYTGNIQAGNLLTTNAMYTTTGVFWAGNNAPFSSLQLGGYNSSLQFNNADNLDGTTYLQYDLITGNLTSNSLTDSTDITTGAIVLAGGMGIGANLYVGGNIVVLQDQVTYGDVYSNAVYANTIGNVGTTIIGDTANISGNINSGNINVDGNINVSSNLDVLGNLIVSNDISVTGNLIGANSYISGNIHAGNVFSYFYWPNGVSIFDFSTTDLTVANLSILQDGGITFSDGTKQTTRAPRLWTNWDADFAPEVIQPGDFYYDDGTGGIYPEYASGLKSIYLIVLEDDGTGTGTFFNDFLDMTIRALG